MLYYYVKLFFSLVYIYNLINVENYVYNNVSFIHDITDIKKITRYAFSIVVWNNSIIKRVHCLMVVINVYVGD